MHYKIQGAIKKNRKNFIVYAILWIVIAIVFVVPFSYSSHMAGLNGRMELPVFFSTFGESITDPFGTIGKIFEKDILGTYFSTLLVTTIFYSIFFFIGFVRSAPKNEYTDIEHGSSDWCTPREAYKTLNPDKGIILAEKYYLPLDKRGNVNVMIVGRIWCW